MEESPSERRYGGPNSAWRCQSVPGARHRTDEGRNTTVAVTMRGGPSTTLIRRADPSVTALRPAFHLRDLATEPLELPPALLLLYFATESEVCLRYSALCLLDFLAKLSGVRQHLQRVAMRKQSCALERARCEQLYADAVAGREMMRQRLEARRKEHEVAELSECTFSPAISLHAKALPKNGPDAVVEKCMQWQQVTNERRVRLAEEAARASENSPSWSMTQRSRLLAERRAQKGPQRPALWESKKRAVSCDYNREGSATPRAATASPVKGSDRHPLTARIERANMAYLRRLAHPEQGVTPSCDSLYTGRAGASVSARAGCYRRSNEVAVQGYLTRMEEDLRRREAGRVAASNAAKVLPRKATVRSVSTPRALSTGEREEVQIGFTHLPMAEQDCKSGLRPHRPLDHSGFPARQTNVPLNGRDKVTAPMTESMEARLVAEADRRAAHLEKLRDENTLKYCFHPTITKKSERLAKRQTHGQKIYERQELCLRPPKDDLSPPSPFLVKTSARKMQSMLARNDQWMEERSGRLKRALAERTETELKDCTFTPRRAEVHGAGASPTSRSTAHADLEGEWRAGEKRFNDQQERLVRNADRRLQNELGLLRYQEAFQDADFMQSVMHGSRDPREALRSLSWISFRNAPRPSRSRVSSGPIRSVSASPIEARSASYSPAYFPYMKHWTRNAMHIRSSHSPENVRRDPFESVVERRPDAAGNEFESACVTTSPVLYRGHDVRSTVHPASTTEY